MPAQPTRSLRRRRCDGLIANTASPETTQRLKHFQHRGTGATAELTTSWQRRRRGNGGITCTKRQHGGGGDDRHDAATAMPQWRRGEDDGTPAARPVRSPSPRPSLAVTSARCEALVAGSVSWMRCSGRVVDASMRRGWAKLPARSAGCRRTLVMLQPIRRLSGQECTAARLAQPVNHGPHRWGRLYDWPPRCHSRPTGFWFLAPYEYLLHCSCHWPHSAVHASPHETMRAPTLLFCPYTPCHVQCRPLFAPLCAVACPTVSESLKVV